MIIINALPENYCEIDYIGKLISECNRNLDDSYALLLIHNDLKISNPFQNYKHCKKIAIHVGDEWSNIHHLYDECDIVFRFFHTDFCDNKKIFNLNIGYNSSGYNDILFDNSKPLTSRSKDVFFMGQPRGNFQDVISKFKDIYDITSTGGFRSGISIHDYVSSMADSKICLVPNGLILPETYRYTEAFASGCIVITTAKTNSWYFEKSPAYFLDTWSDFNQNLVNSILNSDVDKLQADNIHYYNKYLSPSSNADYILSKCKHL